ncbi:unnamed protein product [Phytophthora fragariaefolia]|uniref:Unnamed protein product n=1 Tax=Phytophthora fragariaefolia TaxID=1490495 RepID=A0A9W6Y8R7_9STRA|nr:unnamed protein product [Phytophthora fragariaefolia]
MSLYPDESSFVTCPLHAIAMALAMQDFPVASLLDLKQLSTVEKDDAHLALDKRPLAEALQRCGDGDSRDDVIPPRKSGRRAGIGAPPQLKMQGYVNQVAKEGCARLADADITPNLSSHSFRRGGAQHAKR